MFEKPFAVHAELPAGTPAMIRLKDSITYRFEDTDRGGVVKIVASAPDAVAAVHEFLRYQIREHRTGDSLNGVR